MAIFWIHQNLVLVFTFHHFWTKVHQVALNVRMTLYFATTFQLTMSSCIVKIYPGPMNMISFLL